ncbi:MAG TPA: peptide-methionine (S)-S-oxide reductase MsrA, partial [Gemmatimonadota bacterium]|nr:peptide-methionine (S)-S-oxide reductase MsrA [Gemmatimonadota bacterium]
GGCFWGVQAVFQRVRGVEVATAGYAGGSAATASYGMTSTGRTGHAESVRVVYDPGRVSYGTLLRLFFTVVHDPTQKNRQGPDIGTQYRSAIWTTSPRQARLAHDFIARLERNGIFQRPIVTEVHPLDGFYPAETYHQDYLLHHPEQPYIAINDLPKVRALRRDFPDLWRTDPAPWRTTGPRPEP